MSTVPDQCSFTASGVKQLRDSMNLKCTFDWLIALPNSIVVHLLFADASRTSCLSRAWLGRMLPEAVALCGLRRQLGTT